MSLRSLTGIVLVVAHVITFNGFFGLLLPVTGTPDGSSQFLDSMGNNTEIVLLGIVIGTLGLILTGAGLGLLHTMMGDGLGSPYMQLGILFIILGTTMLIGEGALFVSSSSQASQARFANALSFFQISQALGSFGASTCGVGFAIVGLALAIQKNLNTIIAYAFILIGLIGSIISLWDYTSNLMLIWNVGSALLALISGILILRSKE